VRVPLVLGPYEAKVIVVGPLPGPAQSLVAEPSFAAGSTLAELDGGWMRAPAAGVYRTQFTAAATTGKRVYLEIADVHDYARVTVNGKDVGAHAWQPYRWDVTGVLKAGANEVEIQVSVTPAGGRGAAPPAVAGLAGPVRVVAR
jgi:hypothetical protein